MKCVDTIARIRREFFVAGKTIKQIVRELHVSRPLTPEGFPSESGCDSGFRDRPM